LAFGSPDMNGDAPVLLDIMMDNYMNRQEQPWA
jgi:hypothetical protein